MQGNEELVEEPFRRLSQAQQLLGYVYDGFWASMDTIKDKQHLESLYASGTAPWEVWKAKGKGHDHGIGLGTPGLASPGLSSHAPCTLETARLDVAH